MICRTAAILTALVLCTGLAACGKKTDSEVQAESSSSVIKEDSKGPSADSTDSIVYDEDAVPAAKAAYEGLCKRLSLFAMDYELTIQEALELKYPESCSDTGLDLSADKPKAEGDADIYSAARETGIAAGTVFVQELKEGEKAPKVRYISPDGGEGIYPDDKQEE